LTVLDEALQIGETTGERWFAAELNRYRGELLLRQEHSEAAEELYDKALASRRATAGQALGNARRHKPPRLRRDQGRNAEARDLVAPVYGWFTEGFGTPDLKRREGALFDELRYGGLR
jgi:predicted ATPase